MKTSLTSPFTVADANPHCLISIPNMPAGRYQYAWTALLNGIGGNGNNGQMFIGFGDCIAGSGNGAPAACVLSECSDQFADLSPNGDNEEGVGLAACTPPRPLGPTTAAPAQNPRVLSQVGSFTLAAPGAVEIWMIPGGYDPADVQVITDLILSLTPLP